MTFAADTLADDAVVQASDAQITTIAALADQQLGLESAIADLEGSLKEKKDHLKKVQEIQLPEAMALAGVTEFKLTNGAKISIKEDLSVSVPKSRMLEIAAWLKANGLGDILKETMVVALDDNTKAEQLKAFITSNQMSADAKLDVNTSTLKAVLREQLADGKDIDLKFFGGFAWKRAIITQATGKA